MNLQEAKDNPQLFYLGEAVKTYHIGEYDIVKYKEKCSVNGEAKKHKFVTFVGEISTIADTLELAVAYTCNDPKTAIKEKIKVAEKLDGEARKLCRKIQPLALAAYLAGFAIGFAWALFLCN